MDNPNEKIKAMMAEYRRIKRIQELRDWATMTPRQRAENILAQAKALGARIKTGSFTERLLMRTIEAEIRRERETDRRDAAVRRDVTTLAQSILQHGDEAAQELARINKELEIE